MREAEGRSFREAKRCSRQSESDVIAAMAPSLAFFLSFLWYTLLFGKASAKEMGIDPNEKPTTSTLAKSLLLTVISMFLISLVLSSNIAVWTPNIWGIKRASISKESQAFYAAFFTWHGVFIPNLLHGLPGNSLHH